MLSITKYKSIPKIWGFSKKDVVLIVMASIVVWGSNMAIRSYCDFSVFASYELALSLVFREKYDQKNKPRKDQG